MMRSLRNQIGREEFDYPALMAALSDHARPNDRVTTLLHNSDIIRVKKGIYIFGADNRRRPYSRELLANLVYGPSFVSLDSALSFHGLIPERVGQVTSVTTGRGRRFNTPIGTFVYRPTPLRSFQVGMSLIERGDISFLIATPERALADKVREDRKARIRSLREAKAFLFDDLRINRDSFERLDPDALFRAGRSLGSRKALLCAELLERIRRNR